MRTNDGMLRSGGPETTPARSENHRRWVAFVLAASTIMAGLAATPVAAQEAAFRVPIGLTGSATGVPPVYAWLERVSECSAGCGSGSRTTSYQCQNAADFDYSGNGYGAPEPDGECGAAIGAKPTPGQSACTNYSGCGYDWVKPAAERTALALGSHPVGRVGCGYVHESFSPYCQRTGGGAAVVLSAADHRFCRSDSPDYDHVAAGDPDALGYDRNVVQTASCSAADHEWRSGDFGAFDDTCSSTAVQTRMVSCHRRFDGEASPDAACDPSARPSSTNVQAVYTSCSYDWTGATDGAWGAWSSNCSGSATRTRAVTCRRSNGDIVADSECLALGNAKPETSETRGVYTDCTYAAGGAKTYGSWSSGCSPRAVRTVSSQCVRSDGSVVAATECTDRGTEVTSNQTEAIYDQCSYSFSIGEWSDWSGHCTVSGTHTRSITCQRSDGTSLADSECTDRGVARPSSSETTGVYDGCSYGRGSEIGVSDWSSHCSSTAKRTHFYACRRSDGAIVADAECGTRSVGLALGEEAQVYDGCGYEAVNWSDWSACADGRQTSAASCRRSDGAIVAASECESRNRPTSRTQTCSAPVAEWVSIDGYCSGIIMSTGTSEINGPMPDIAAWRQKCAEQGGKCFAHSFSEQHDYDGRYESWSDNIYCGTDAVLKQGSTGSYANANSSGYDYTERRN